MTVLWADNFSIYGTTSGLMLNGIYAEVQSSLGPDPDGVSDGNVLRCTGGGFNGNVMSVRYVLQNGAVATLGMSLRVWLPALPYITAVGPRPMTVRDADNNPLFFVRINATGTISINHGVTNAVLAITTPPVVTANGWYHIEGKFDKAGAVLNGEIRVEGIPVLDVDGMAVPAAAMANACICNFNDNANLGPLYYAKDFVVWDGLGTDNNNFLGSVLVENMITTADAALNWTPTGAANGYSILDNIPPVDASFIAAGYGPFPSPYVGVLSDLPDDVTSVKALITVVRAAKNDGGDGSMQVGLISDPTGVPATALGSNRPITVAQTYWRDVFERDPKTGAPWLPGAANAARIQINRTV